MPSTLPRPQWLATARFYEIYPQSFADSNGDGIGDIPGIISKLDYIRDLGCNALWINPCFDSPFKDAGYDVRDYLKVAPRYGTNDDLIALFDEAHRRGMHVLLDLVPGHTSEEHPWFRTSSLKVAPRYGTNDDLIALFDEAHRRGMHVLLDLVPGHTSEEHPWFRTSSRPERNQYSDRYIWTDSWLSGADGLPFIGGETPRNGTYVLNFFKCQPALNYGFAHLERYIWTDSWLSGADGLPFIGGETPRNGTYVLNFFKCQPALNYGFAHLERPWQMGADSPAAAETRQAMVDVMRFWLSQGCDGFRVDMANSLVKNDDAGKTATIAAWRQMLGTVKNEYPEAAFVSEWGVPEQALRAGFDMDFYLDWSWDRNGYYLLCRNTPDPLDRERDHSYFSAHGGGSIHGFLDQYLPQYEATKDEGHFCLITCNHDTARLAPRLTPEELAVAYVHGFLDQYLPQYEATKDEGHFCLITCNHDTARLAPRLTPEELAVAYGMILTMPGVPFLYYGDEIGMRYRNLPTKEGGYVRTGTRTPMQWDASANLGFSTADAVPVLRRRDRHAVPQPAHQGGRLRPHRHPHPDAVGRERQPRLLHGRRRRPVPAGRPGSRRADRRGPTGGRRIAVPLGPHRAGAAREPCRAAGRRRLRRRRGAGARTPLRLCAHLPRRLGSTRHRVESRTGARIVPAAGCGDVSRHPYDGTQSGQCGGRRHHGDAWPAEFRGTPTMELSRGNVAADGTTVTLGPQSFVVFSF